MSRTAHLEQFYDLLDQLEQKFGGKRHLADCNGQMGWPKRGVYFFFEPNEFRTTQADKMRVVRVGTHAVSSGSKSTLWGRLRSHKGLNSGGGNHRGSIFRLHVGAALLAKTDIELATWGVNSSASREIRQNETQLEQQVSAYIGKMPFLWLAVDDEPSTASHRSVIEKNSIILLAGQDGYSPLDKSSREWLGHWSARDKIRQSGLWNLNYVASLGQQYSYDAGFLDLMKDYVEAM